MQKDLIIQMVDPVYFAEDYFSCTCPKAVGIPGVNILLTPGFRQFGRRHIHAGCSGAPRPLPRPAPMLVSAAATSKTNTGGGGGGGLSSSIDSIRE